MDMTFQFGGGNVSLSVCMAAEWVPCGFWVGLATSDGSSIMFLDGGGGGGVVVEVTVAAVAW
jgi:hypothetical protein